MLIKNVAKAILILFFFVNGAIYTVLALGQVTTPSFPSEASGQSKNHCVSRYENSQVSLRFTLNILRSEGDSNILSMI